MRRRRQRLLTVIARVTLSQWDRTYERETKMQMRGLIVSCVLLASALAGCASVPMASLQADASAKEFRVKPGHSNIYLYRNEGFGGAVAMTVSLDGKVMGRTAAHTYFVWEVDPGNHEIASHTENTAKLTLETKEGRNYYVWQEVKMGMWQPGSQLHEVSEEEGRKGVRECKLAAPQ